MTRIGWIRLIVIIVAIGILELACRTGLIDHRVMIAPSEMAVALARLLVSGSVNHDLLLTLGVVVTAVGLSVVIGFALGLGQLSAYEFQLKQ